MTINALTFKQNFTRLFPLVISLFLTACNLANQAMVENTGQNVRHDFPYESKFVEVNGAKMHFVDTGGSGSPILLIHGQPTWSYLWRDVIPELEGDHRVIALDLIGFGKSEKPNINYTIEEHAVYLKGFINALDLHDLTLVTHDWGGFLGFDYAAKNPIRIKALAFMETVIPDKAPSSLSPDQDIEQLQGFAKILTLLSTPGVGEKMIYEDNMFIEQLLPSAMKRQLSEDEMNAYREPFSAGKNRLPMLQFPREVGILGNISDYVLNSRKNFAKHLQTTEVPALLLTFSPGALMTQEKINWVKSNIKNSTVQHIGDSVHFVQEDHPKAIGSAISQWMQVNNI